MGPSALPTATSTSPPAKWNVSPAGTFSIIMIYVQRHNIHWWNDLPNLGKVSSKHPRNTAKRPATVRRYAGKHPRLSAAPTATFTPAAVKWKSETAGKQSILWHGLRRKTTQFLQAYNVYSNKNSKYTCLKLDVQFVSLDVTFSKSRSAIASRKSAPSPTARPSATAPSRNRFAVPTATFTPVLASSACWTVGTYHHRNDTHTHLKETVSMCPLQNVARAL